MADFLKPAPQSEKNNLGAMDQDFCTLLASSASNLAGYTSPTSIGKVYIGNCAGLAVYLNYDRNTAATPFEFYWYFTDSANSNLFQPCSIAIGAGGMVWTPLSLTLTADLKTVMHIPNPGAHIIDFYVDANATPNDSDLGVHVIRTGIVSEYWKD